ncbi:MAG: DUF4250 domain-containing protein [Eubacterium sp.]|nr:DUF4250 domain-containing protein [Eubacterium sp.]
MLPRDPVMLLSYVNTKLRDEYPSLQEFCASNDIDEYDLCMRIADLEYHYNREKNQFER